LRASATTKRVRLPFEEQQVTFGVQVDLRWAQETLDMNLHRMMVLQLMFTGVAGPLARAQTLVDSADSSSTAASVTQTLPDLTYVRPTESIKVHNYLFDTFGPYPIAGAAFVAGIGQTYNSPPEWKQGAEGFSKRFGSAFSIAAISTTTRYGLAEAFKEDTLYYRCQCKGVFPRLRHAVISTLTARRGDDGHHVFSFPSLIAPYAGTMTAVYAWYPDRYNYKDAFRMGNYTMLGYVGGNIALEFLYSGPHSLLSRMHLNNSHGAPNPESNP
jgi:hypothetical protein